MTQMATVPAVPTHKADAVAQSHALARFGVIICFLAASGLLVSGLVESKSDNKLNSGLKPTLAAVVDIK